MTNRSYEFLFAVSHGLDFMKCGERDNFSEYKSAWKKIRIAIYT